MEGHFALEENSVIVPSMLMPGGPGGGGTRSAMTSRGSQPEKATTWEPTREGNGSWRMDMGPHLKEEDENRENTITEFETESQSVATKKKDSYS